MEEKPIDDEKIAQTAPALSKPEKQRSKPKNGSKIAIIILAILATAGLGFGIYGFFFKKSEEKPVQNAISTTELESELTNLKKKYSILQNYVEELEASGAEIPEDAKSATKDNPPETAIDTGKYIYVNEWGIKIKLPEELALVTYSYDYYIDGPVEKAGYSTSLCISGSEDKALYAFSSVGKATPGLVCISRDFKQREHLVDAVEIFHDDSGWYYLSGAQAYYTEADTMARGYEASIVELFKQHFSNPSNYSAI